MATQILDAYKPLQGEKTIKTVRQKIANRAQRILSSSILQCRQINARYRSLPDFIIIGAQKSGTSSMYAYLRQHPQIISAYKKEVHYFDGGKNPLKDNFQRKQRWYKAHFPLKRNLRKEQRTFEASPLYIFNPLVPERIAELVPDVKLIAILRNPTERAISHYYHEKRKGREKLPIMAALQAEEERLRAVIDRQDFKSNAFIHYSYKSRGIYHEQIKRYLSFFPRSRLLIINSENFFSEPHNELKRIFHFLCVGQEVVIEDLRPKNIGLNRETVEPDVYEYLQNFFYPHNQALFALIGEKYNW